MPRARNSSQAATNYSNVGCDGNKPTSIDHKQKQPWLTMNGMVVPGASTCYQEGSSNRRPSPGRSTEDTVISGTGTSGGYAWTNVARATSVIHIFSLYSHAPWSWQRIDRCARSDYLRPRVGTVRSDSLIRLSILFSTPFLKQSRNDHIHQPRLLKLFGCYMISSWLVAREHLHYRQK